MSLRLQDLYYGSLGSIHVKDRTLTKQLLEDHQDFIKEAETAYKKFIEILRNGDEFYAKIHEGCRSGSIVRVSSNQYKVAPASRQHYGRQLGLAKISSLIAGILLDDYRYGPKFMLEVATSICTSISYNSRIKAKYDDRKEVALSHDEQTSLEFLPDYEGPTVYCFTRTERTPEERAAKRDPGQHKVFDQLGDEIQLGDLFLYGGANTLLIGKLIKVTEQGSLAYTAFIGGGSGRISTEMVRRQVKKGEKVSCLLKYSKDLGDRLMLFKLSN